MILTIYLTIAIVVFLVGAKFARIYHYNTYAKYRDFQADDLMVPFFVAQLWPLALVMLIGWFIITRLGRLTMAFAAKEGKLDKLLEKFVPKEE